MVQKVEYQWQLAYSSVAVPDVNVNVWDRLAGAGVNELDVQVEGHTLLGLGDIVADELASHIWSD